MSEMFLHMPSTKEGYEAEKILKEAGFDFATISKSSDSKLRFLTPRSSFKGLKQIKSFVSDHKEITQKN